MDHFHIIQALCRSALANPTNAVIQQIERLKNVLETDGHVKEAKALVSMLNNVNKNCEMAPSRINQSFVFSGEELTEKTLVPVDKESSTPLVDIIFPNNLPHEAPLLNSNIKYAIESVLNEWRHFEKLSDIQAKPAGSCLIYGLPGTGKTHLALWIAAQLELPVVVARLDGLMSSFLGTTSKNIGNLFSFASRYRCILLLDEFDAIAKLRNDPQEVGEIKRVVNTLLQNLDNRRGKGFTIGITNHEALLDPAIWRRFEVQIEIPKPSVNIMPSLVVKLLQPLELEEVEVKFLAWSIANGSGADVEAMINWLKKSYVLDSDSSLVNHIRKFAILNTGRVDSIKKSILEKGDEDLVSALLEDTSYSFKKKDIAQLVGKTPSSISKQLAKAK